MSQRALKKKGLMNISKQEREQHQPYQQKFSQSSSATKAKATNTIGSSNGAVAKQTDLIASKISSRSTPNLHELPSTAKDSSTSGSSAEQENSLKDLNRSHSETDLSRIPEEKILVNAKSEFHLKSIAVTNVTPIQYALLAEAAVSGPLDQIIINNNENQCRI